MKISQRAIQVLPSLSLGEHINVPSSGRRRFLFMDTIGYK
jgi:hypothetical protein